MKKIIFVFLVLLMAFQLTACSSEASKALREANKAFENENWTDAQVAANQVILNYPGTKESAGCRRTYSLGRIQHQTLRDITTANQRKNHQISGAIKH